MELEQDEIIFEKRIEMPVLVYLQTWENTEKARIFEYGLKISRVCEIDKNNGEVLKMYSTHNDFHYLGRSACIPGSRGYIGKARVRESLLRGLSTKQNKQDVLAIGK